MGHLPRASLQPLLNQPLNQPPAARRARPQAIYELTGETMNLLAMTGSAAGK